ncbi:MAG: hypothetical protein ACLFPO_04125 [Spirochaetaceae bacterium]
MEVLINEEQVDVTLEEEQTLGEVMEGLRAWLKDSQLFITDVVVDEKDVSLDAPESWARTRVDDINRIEIMAMPPWEVKAAGLQVLVQYFTLLRDAIRSGDDRRLEEISGEAGHVARSLPSYAEDLVDTRDRTDIFHRVVDAPEVREGSLPDPDRATELLRYLDQAVTVLTSRAREISRPQAEAIATAQTIRGLIPEMNEISVMLQRNEDRRAMDSLVRFTELVGKLLRIMPHMVRAGDVPQVSTDRLEEYGAELNATLEEMVDAFGTQDSVLIGDLVEYELVPKIEELLDSIPAAGQDTQS